MYPKILKGVVYTTLGLTFTITSLSMPTNAEANPATGFFANEIVFLFDPMKGEMFKDLGHYSE